MKRSEQWLVTSNGDYECALVRVYIRNNETGTVRSYLSNEPFFYDEDEHPSVFNWEENNFSCDCNRRLFFERADGNDPDYSPCGEGGYSVNLQNAKDNEYYYKEF